MRSRYTAYTLQNISYLEATLDPAELQSFDRIGTAMWARNSDWMGLEIIKTSAGAPGDREGSVEFRARYKRDGVIQEHHEVSRFQKIKGHWLYCGGKGAGPEQFRREAPKTSRNDPCPCGSGRKYKKCCGN